MDRASLEAFRDDAGEIMNEWENACLRANSLPPAETFKSLMRCAHNLKGNAGLMGFDAFRDAIHELEERLMALNQAGANPADIGLVGILFEVERFLRDWLKNLVDNPDYTPDNLNILSRLEAWQTQQRPTEAKEEETRREFTAVEDGTVRIPAQKLETLIQLVSELTLAQAIVTRGRSEETLNRPETLEAIALCDRLVRGLRTTVLDMRMLPMMGLYKKLERAGMELSIQLNKPLNFLTDGHEVAADKAVLNRIFDPLLHLLRNSIDHGIESPKDRKAAGKPQTGTIRISAQVAPGVIVLTIKDDGRGLDLIKIQQKAIAKGLISDGAKLSEDEIANLIFEPGFSTADQVTDISGRGVGMDVVKKEVIGLGGQIEISSQPGVGTEIQITLPANISLIDALVIGSEGQSFCIPTQDVSEIVGTDEAKLEESSLGQVLVLRDQLIPVEPLSFFLPQTRRASTVDSQESFVFVINFQDQLLGLKVDRLYDQQQVFVRPLKGYLSTLPRLTGSTILSNGQPALVINVRQMANDYFLNQRRGPELGKSPN